MWDFTKLEKRDFYPWLKFIIRFMQKTNMAVYKEVLDETIAEYSTCIHSVKTVEIMQKLRDRPMKFGWNLDLLFSGKDE